jgi:hypothetical protein
MAFNLGRPAVSFSDDTIKQARRLLDHPLSIKSDSRLIAYCEMLAFRSRSLASTWLTPVPIHQPFSIAPNNDFLPDFDDKLRVVNEQVEAWHVYWDQWQQARGVPEGDILREGRESTDEVRADSSDHGQIWNDSLLECSNLAWYTA